jgi:DNA-binding transcriptional regulator YhcF (GntR family)
MSGFIKTISINREQIMAMSGIGNKNTYTKAIKYLHEQGFLIYEASNNPYVGSKVTITTFGNSSGKGSGNSSGKTSGKASGKGCGTFNKPIKTKETIQTNKQENIYRSFDHLSIANEEVEKLKAMGYTLKKIDDILDQIENYKGNKNYRSLYITAKNWLGREKKEVVRINVPKPNFI